MLYGPKTVSTDLVCLGMSHENRKHNGDVSYSGLHMIHRWAAMLKSTCLPFHVREHCIFVILVHVTHAESRPKDSLIDE